MGKQAVLRKLVLHLNNNVDLVLHNVRVVKDIQRHIVTLVANPRTIVLSRDSNKRIYAFSGELGLFAMVPFRNGENLPNIPNFIIKLLS